MWFILLVPLITLTGQSEESKIQRRIREAGLPFITNYTPENYGAFSQNWGVVQDSLGMLYFANGYGVLTYNGVSWQVIELPNHSHAKSIAIDKDNRVYVGASGEFGYLEPDESGRINYVSLSTLLSKQDQNFTTVWETHATPEGIYFRSASALYRWKNGDFKIWRIENPQHTFHNSFWVNSTLYIRVFGKGLMYLKDDKLEMIPKGEFFADKGVRAIFPYAGNLLLIGTYNAFYLYSNSNITLFKTAVDDFIDQNKLYSGLQLSNGSFALTTFYDGITIIDNMGRELLRLSKKQTNAVQSVRKLLQDQSGVLWAALDYGIAKIEFPSPYSHYEDLGLNAVTTALARYKESMYAGTGIGLFKLVTENNSKITSFVNVKGIGDFIWDLMVFDDRLLIARDAGLFELSKGVLTPIGKWKPSSVCRSLLDSNRVFISLENGLGSIYNNEGSWIDEGIIPGVNSSTYDIIEDVNTGNLWLETSEDWVWRISFDTKEQAINLKNPVCEKFNAENGLPKGNGKIYKVEGLIYFVSDIDHGTFVYDTVEYKFKKDSTLNKFLGLPDENIYINHVDANDNIFFSTYDNLKPKYQIAWASNKNNYSVEDLNEERISDLISDGESMYFDSQDSIIWYAGNKGVVRHDLGIKQDDFKYTHAVLRKVRYLEDSLLIEGPYNSKNSEIPFKHNSFRFEYANPYYYLENANEFQYKLKGFDEHWSSWSLETQKDYTNLPEGEYVFIIRARNIFGQISKEANYFFKILPPWYRTWWSYLSYVIIMISMIYLLVQWRSRQLRRQNLALEAIIMQRTADIAEKNTILENQTVQLKEQTEQLKVVDTMKTRFFANISHEFRTPLTLIKGPIDELEQSQKTNLSFSNVKMIRRNANSLLKMVNQLLDLSKLDTGNLKLNLSEEDVFKHLRAAASSFSSHAAQRNISYKIEIPSNVLWASVDRDKLEKVVYNLLSNAFKFTSDNSTIGISANYLQNQLEIQVMDSGYGIPSDKLPHIFDRFFQVDDTFTKEKEGTGIGLALTKELVELMGGKIYVESKYEKGSVFKVVVPLEEIEHSEINEKDDNAGREETFEPGTEPLEMKKTDGRGSKSVLIIEDNIDMREFISQHLVDRYRLIEAFNGVDGIKKAKERMPDLIITDLMMPQMDGITLCRNLKEDIHTSHIPVIMLTAKAGIENKIEGLETGADDYLTKPFSVKELRVRVKNLIEQRQKLRELFSKSSTISPREITVTSLDEQFLQKLLKLLEENYSDSDFDITHIQVTLAMSKAHLHRKVKAITNLAPGELLRNFRLKRAAQILEQKGDNVTQVAFSVGFNNLSYFAKCFRELYGMSPSEYLNNKNNSDSDN